MSPQRVRTQVAIANRHSMTIPPVTFPLWVEIVGVAMPHGSDVIVGGSVVAINGQTYIESQYLTIFRGKPRPFSEQSHEIRDQLT